MKLLSVLAIALCAQPVLATTYNCDVTRSSLSGVTHESVALDLATATGIKVIELQQASGDVWWNSSKNEITLMSLNENHQITASARLKLDIASDLSRMFELEAQSDFENSYPRTSISMSCKR